MLGRKNLIKYFLPTTLRHLVASRDAFDEGQSCEFLCYSTEHVLVHK